MCSRQKGAVALATAPFQVEKCRQMPEKHKNQIPKNLVFMV